MQIQKVQPTNNNPMFKSKVHMNFNDARSVGKLLKDEILILQHNGQDDVVFLTHHNNMGAYENELSLNVIKKDKNNLVEGQCKKIISKVLERNGLTKMYEEAKTDMKPIENNPIYYIL